MTAPMSGAIRGASYSGTMGGLAGDFAQAAGSFVKGMKDAEAQRQARAMEQALLELKQRAQDSGDQQAASELEIRRQQLQATREAAEADRDLRKEQFSSTRADREADNRRQDSRDAETARHNRELEKAAGQRIEMSGDRFSRGWAPVVTQDKDGRIMIVDKNDRSVTPTRAAGAGVATDAAGTPVGAGARPAQGERDAAAAYENLHSALNQLESQMAGVGFQPPSIGEQVAIDAARSPGTGVMSSLKRGVANTYLGKQAPEYQQIEQSVKTLGTLVVKMVTGAQMSEPEAQRIMGILQTVAGDQPDVARQKLNAVKEIIRGQRVKLGRAEGLIGQGAAPAQAAPAAGSSLKQKYGLE